MVSEAKQVSTESLWNNFHRYNLSFFKKTTNPRRWQCRQRRAHSTWNALAASRWGLLATPHPAQSHAKRSCLQEKAKVNYERNGVGIAENTSLTIVFCSRKHGLENFGSVKNVKEWCRGGFTLSWGWDHVPTWDPFKLKLFFGFLGCWVLWVSPPRGAKESTSWRRLSVCRL